MSQTEHDRAVTALHLNEQLLLQLLRILAAGPLHLRDVMHYAPKGLAS